MLEIICRSGRNICQRDYLSGLKNNVLSKGGEVLWDF
jgi:hypothetical protein